MKQHLLLAWMLLVLAGVVSGTLSLTKPWEKRLMPMTEGATITWSSLIVSYHQSGYKKITLQTDEYEYPILNYSLTYNGKDVDTEELLRRFKPTDYVMTYTVNGKKVVSFHSNLKRDVIVLK